MSDTASVSTSMSMFARLIFTVENPLRMKLDIGV